MNISIDGNNITIEINGESKTFSTTEFDRIQKSHFDNIKSFGLSLFNYEKYKTLTDIYPDNPYDRVD